MSVDYYGTLATDRDRCLAILRGEDTSLPLPRRNELRAVLLADIPGLKEEGPSHLYQLMWWSTSYIQVYVNEHSVVITHGTANDDQLIETLTSIFDILKQFDLHVFDPQQDDFLLGHGIRGASQSDTPRCRQRVPIFACSSCEDETEEWDCIHCGRRVDDRCCECHNELEH
ncbi:MAG: hypothetical protein R3C18_20355 [Planctomycetaceae bacterium]